MPEVSILKSSANLESKVDEVWIQNMWMAQDRLEVRPGWGQLAQLDTTLALATDTNKFGYENHLGSVLIETDFGHEQIFSVFSGNAALENLGEGGYGNTFNKRIFIRIYDVTTNRNWEEVLCVHTSSQVGPPLYDRVGWYAGTTGHSTGFLNGADEEFFFAVFAGNLFFGNKLVGTHVYFPADFRSNKNKQIQTSESAAWISGYSETSLIAPLKLSPGIDYKTHRYLSQGEMGAVAAIEVVANRMAYAVGNTIWFSDINYPASVKGTDYQTISSERSIIALKRFKDVLLVFTDSEMFYYAPNNSSLASGGRLVRVSDSIGCLSQNTIREVDGAIVWVDRSGIYRTSSGLDTEDISAPIKTFFTEENLVTNPMTSYFETTGGAASPTVNDHPRNLLPFRGDNVSIAYDSKKKAILISFPELNGMWCFRNGWSWWTVESVVSTSGAPLSPEVKRVENLLNPWVLSGRSGLYTIFSKYQYTLTDQASHRPSGTSLVAQSDNLTPTCYILCKLGRGGGTDRSSAILYDFTVPRKPAEDQRSFGGKYRAVVSNQPSTSGTLYARPPVVLDNGDHLVPFEYFSASGVNFVEDLHFNFWYDSTKWKASGWNAAADDTTIDILLSPEMGSLEPAFTIARTVNAAGALAVGTSAVGIQIFVNSSAVVTTYSGINTTRGIPTPMFYIRFRPINGVNQTPLNGLGFSQGIAATGDKIGQEDGLGNFTAANFYAWSPLYAPATKVAEASAAEQAVDWALKSDQIDPEGGQIMARGLFAEVKSTGSASTQIASGWLWGVYNVLLGSDFKGWVSQIVDYNNNITKVVNKLTIRSRMMDSDGDMQTKTFNGTPKWSSAGNSTDGNYLIDDVQEDEIAISDTVKGQRLSYMVFGFIRNKAERFGMKGLAAVIRPSGRRRRRIGR